MNQNQDPNQKPATDPSSIPATNAKPERELNLNDLVQNLSLAVITLSRDLPTLIREIHKLEPEERQALSGSLKPIYEAAQVICAGAKMDHECALPKGARNLFVSHPWHGVSAGDCAPEIVRTIIEIVPTDTIKYEVDKETGLLKADRPQLFSALCPANYGYIPQTYCGEKVAEFCALKAARQGVVGDGDPLDICVISSHSMPHGNFMLDAIPIGGFRMIDRNQADDKIIAILKGDPAFGDISGIDTAPKQVIEKLKHYFLVYKDMPGVSRNCEITHVYGRDEALEIIRRAQQDYRDKFAE